ncbi:hypothetical protein FRACYDRAFT_249595 [Fragilariopsis cylindrus CCMP1102]|uniref:Uncharacterized protein n=1 Tax=Fragilariopsis cylindrus CCMP1102 TaxID=635003 RepID=A0A1E7ES70_9STRA|nr:hypothetical protein FRACYDRAFT_249595 [Fragilariopsis cylindrus CCMP1102]|eukprot:OEU08695.1 hypothetical protein FRACYDRAFT_249595 [Fragilariopsis cylindrus CCMP1102]
MPSTPSSKRKRRGRPPLNDSPEVRDAKKRATTQRKTEWARKKAKKAKEAIAIVNALEIERAREKANEAIAKVNSLEIEKDMHARSCDTVDRGINPVDRGIDAIQNTVLPATNGIALLLKGLEGYGSSSDEDDDDDGDDVSADLKPSTTKRWNPLNKKNEVICLDCNGDVEDGVDIVPPTAASMPTSRVIVSSDDENDDDNGDDEIQIVKTIGDNPLEHYAHARPDCVVFPFVDKRRGSDSNKIYCEQCFCFVCDRPSSECVEWSTNHCNAIGGDVNSKWEKLRQLRRDEEQLRRDEQLRRQHLVVEGEVTCGHFSLRGNEVGRAPIFVASSES